MVEMKLGMYALYIISVTITCFHDDRIGEKASGNIPPQTSMHGGETWCACV